MPPKEGETLQQALERLGLADLFEPLGAAGLDAQGILELTEEDLRELNLNLGQRKRVLRAQRAAAGAAAGEPAPAPPRPAAQAAERRQLTTLFVDLVGFTQLAAAMDPEDLAEVVETYQSLCKTVIEEHAGHVAFSQGDGLMVYFGFPQAGEDDAERAVRAGLEIHRRLREAKTAVPRALQARVGIATGLVVVADHEDAGVAGARVLGETPNLAARLQSEGGPADTIIADATRRLCGGLFEYEARGDVVLKGFPEPVTIYRVLGEGRAMSRFEARASGGLSPIVGRDVELSTVLGHWAATVAQGAGRAVLVRGEAGIGKSRLARACIEMVARPAHRPRVLRWYCAPHLANHALHPLIRELEGIADLGRNLPAERRRPALEALVAASPRLVPEDAEILASLLGLEDAVPEAGDPAARARRTQDTLARRIEGMASEGPLLILLEDAHWADAATLDFVGLLLDRVASLPAMLLVTHRPEFVPGWDLAGRGGSVWLDPLAAAAGARLVDMVVRERALPAQIVAMIIERSAGVPLFVEELTKAVLDAFLEVGSDAAAIPSLAIPATLHDSLMARLDQLGEAKELAQVGSVLGREFTAAMLRAVAPEGADIEAGLRRLCASGLAYESPAAAGGRCVTFHHALVQEAAYESLLRRRRRDIHRAVAEAMLAGHPAFAGTEPEVVARHCARGGLAAEAVAHWLQAGLHALDRAAAGAAAAHLGAALEQLALLPEDEERSRTELRVQMALAPANMAIHGWASREVEAGCRRAVELAQAVGDGVSRFGASWGLWTNYFLRGETEQALETARAVDGMARAVGAPALRAAADHAAGFTLYYRGELEAALAHARSGAALCDAATDREIVRGFQLSSAACIHAFAAGALWMMGQEAEADAAMERSFAVSEAHGHAPSIAFSQTYNCWLLAHRGDWERVRRHATRAAALSEAEGFRMWLPLARVFLSLCDAAAGRLESGLAGAFAHFEQFAATGTGITQCHIHAMFGEFLIAAGRPEEAVRRMAPRLESALRRGEHLLLSEVYRVRAEAHRAMGAEDLARADHARAVRVARAQGATTLLRRAEASQIANVTTK